MFETIAAATGETIHWVGNKAAPIPACVDRIRDDLGRFLTMAAELIVRADGSLRADPLAQYIIATVNCLHEKQPGLAQFKQLPFDRQRRLLDIESINEDLDLIAQSASTILKIKEDLIGPARQQNLQEVDLVALIRANLRQDGLPDSLVTVQLKTAIPNVKIDPVQFDRVLDNLIKNALEAMEAQPKPRLRISIWKANAHFVRVAITDNGCGIPEADMTKIWLKFHTSKADKGGTGLGLPACLQIMEAMGGQISVSSEVGVGSTFTLHVPIYRSDQT
jgi:signal transduction histidine kinase